MTYKLKVKCPHDEMIELHRIVPHPRNNNRHSIEQINQLAKLFDYQGIRQPIVVSKLSGFLVKGHGSIQAMEKLGAIEAPVSYQDFDNEAQEYAFITSDNQIAAQAEFDWQAHHISMDEIDFDEIENWDDEFLGIEKRQTASIDDIDKVDEENINTKCIFRVECASVKELETLRGRLEVGGDAIKFSKLESMLK